MTPEQLLQLANLVGPSALDALVRGLFGRHWTTKLVATVGKYPDISTTRAQRRRLRKAMGAFGWELMLRSTRGEPEPLRETVSAALGSGSRQQSDSVATALEANFARSLSSEDFSSVLTMQLVDLRAATARSENKKTGALSNQLGEADYARTVGRMARYRRWRRREVVGLSRDQIAATFGLPDRRVPELEVLAPGGIVFVTAAIGSGKSDTAFEWLARHAEAAVADETLPLPVLLRGDSIPGELETEVLHQLTAAQLLKRGARIVLDGLDEANERALGIAEQAVELASKWPRISIIVTSRISSVPAGVDHVRMSEWSASDAIGLMAAIRSPRDAPSQYMWTVDLRESVRRPLFAILAAQAEDATNAYELISRLVTKSMKRSTDVAHAKLAIEILRRGDAVDLRELSDVAEADLDTDRLVSQIGGRWQFELPIFLQWFAAHGVLSGSVTVDEYTRDVAAFGRWRYVLAVAIAGATAKTADEILAAISNWNPGAASLLIGEVASARLGDQADLASSKQLGERVATSLDAIRLKENEVANGWLAADRIRVAAIVEPSGVAAVQWMERRAGEGAIGHFVRYQDLGSRQWASTLTQVRDYSTLSPWKWNLDELRKQLDHALHAPHLLVGESSIIREEFLHRAWVALGARSPIGSLMINGQLPERLSHNGFEIDRWSLEQLRTRPDVWSRSGPWTPPDHQGRAPGWVGGNYSDAALLARATEVYTAALAAYVDLVEGPFREFGDLLELRATLPARMIVRVTPADDYSPSAGEYLLPLPDRSAGIQGNTLDIALASRDENTPEGEPFDMMESAFTARRQTDPGSALMLSRTYMRSVLKIFGPRPVTGLAVGWLARDLTKLNRLDSNFRELS